jgi:septum formation protein
VAGAIFLASASPRRRELLQHSGLAFEVVSGAGVDETPHDGEDPERLVVRLALAKAQAGAAALGERAAGAVVIGADTEVVLDGRVFGKPRDAADGQAMLLALAGRTHQVLSAVAVVRDGRARAALSRSAVTLRPLAPAEAAAYWATGEPHDKAGGYAIQGRAAAFVTRLEGSYTGVVGLPLHETLELIAALSG